MKVVLLALLILVGSACGPGSRGGQGTADGGPGGADAAGGSDGGTASVDAAFDPYGDADVVDHDGGSCGPQTCANPVEDLCGDAEVCGNGMDDDCDGDVDEQCPCQAGAVQACFRGPPGRRNQGACVDGSQRCLGDGEFAVWGDCEGGIGPRGEACDSQDNNCNGCADDSPECCDVSLTCPGSQDLPEGQPFTDYVIDGTLFNAGAVTSWQWTVTGGPCDQLLAPNVSYTLAGQTTSQLTFRPTLSGDYRVKVRMTLADGSVFECEFIVHVRGPGLRVELCWDTDGQVDIDLHLHQPDNTNPWFSRPADCYFGDCKASSTFNIADWGYANSPLAECEGGPQGDLWTALGYCRNPRLDIDNIDEVGIPENINVDLPEDGKSYRVGVHYFSGFARTKPLVNVYCGGFLKATYGAAPDTVPGFNSNLAAESGVGPFWHVVDVTPQVDATGVTTGCALAPLHPDGQTTGYKVVCQTGFDCDNTSFD
jgi:hypothetical protein